jgi:hypothetical protein
MFAEPTHVGYALVTRPRHDEKVVLTPCETLIDAVRKQDQHDLIASLVMSDTPSNAVDIHLHFIGSSFKPDTQNQIMLLASFEYQRGAWETRHVTGAMIDTFDGNALIFIESLLSFFDLHRNHLGSAIAP